MEANQVVAIVHMDDGSIVPIAMARDIDEARQIATQLKDNLEPCDLIVMIPVTVVHARA